MSTAEPKERLLGFTWNVPNVLTMLRIVLVPVFAWIFLANPHDQTWRWWATAIFVVAILTDSFDGYIARKYDLVTNFGKIWDSIADKALTGVAFILLSVVGELPWVMTIIILAREWGITALRFAILKYGVMAANRGGKLKTLMQSFALIAFLPWLPDLGTWFVALKWTLMWIAFALTVFTGLEYLWEAQKLRRASLAAGGPVELRDGSWQPLATGPVRQSEAPVDPVDGPPADDANTN
ncbi:MAG: CDP-diacylglycerol--glycerol-3-phosphate 3-phosphatidyltransferase [Brooklawnia sp.]|jgi:CDP-diacylglycerol--glycerol-3-phosphate 3-phosphatidyltransferase